MDGSIYKRTKFACYSAYFTMSSIFSLPPLLFVVFHDTYGISYTLLGTLVLTNFLVQLFVDLIFTAFSQKFNYEKILKIMPLLTSLGLFIYALVPTLFPKIAYLGLVLGTVVFSLSAGLSEVLLSPTIAAIPSKNPQRDMSFLHSLYAFGVFTVVLISTLFFKLFSSANWAYLTMFFALLPVIPSLLFMRARMPKFPSSETENSAKHAKNRTTGLLLCVLCIFFGSCAETVMSSWISGYMENALRVNKAVGDMLGMALFAILLGLARIGYARFGKRIEPVLFFGLLGATACYLVAGLSTNAVLAFVACGLTGLFTAMLWPGSLILMEDNLPGLGVTAYALMASGGDLGAALSPQLMGIVTDGVAKSSFAADLSLSIGLSPEQIGLKAGMLVSALFPIIGIVVLLVAIRYFKRKKQT